MSKYQLFDALADEEYAALKADIEERGVLVPVEYDAEGNILDGHHRVRACHELGIEDWPRTYREWMSEEEKRRHVRALNLARRHLTREQRRKVIADALEEAPELSDRAHARELGVSHHTIAAVRTGLIHGGQIAHHEQRVGADGVKQPAHKPAPTREEVEEKVEAAKQDKPTDWLRKTRESEAADRTAAYPEASDEPRTIYGATLNIGSDGKVLSAERHEPVTLDPEPSGGPQLVRDDDDEGTVGGIEAAAEKEFNDSPKGRVLRYLDRVPVPPEFADADVAGVTLPKATHATVVRLHRLCSALLDTAHKESRHAAAS